MRRYTILFLPLLLIATGLTTVWLWPFCRGGGALGIGWTIALFVTCFSFGVMMGFRGVAQTNSYEAFPGSMAQSARDFVWQHWEDYEDLNLKSSLSLDPAFLLLAEACEGVFGPPPDWGKEDV